MLAMASTEHLPLPENSVDLIFTDPPYEKKYLYTYGWLAKEAERVLKPGGFCMAIVPGYWLAQSIALLSESMTWFWALNIRHSGMGSLMWGKRVIVREKILAVVSKGKGLPRCNVLSGLEGGGADKRYHHWGQDVESARYFIDCFSKPGDLVLDPFLGGGTTMIASELIDRRCIGFDIDPCAIATVKQRLDETQFPKALPLFSGMTV